MAYKLVYQTLVKLGNLIVFRLFSLDKNKKENNMPTSVMVIAIVTIIGALLYSAYEQHVKLQMKKENNKVDENLLKELEALKERVATLEKIVTDEKYDLKQKIDSLDKAS